MVDNNSGLYEGSTISTVAIALIPLILWLARFGTIFPPDWRVQAVRACADLRLPADPDRHARRAPAWSASRVLAC